MDLVDDRQSVVELGEQIAAGGEGTVHRVPSRPGLLAKVYSRPATAEREPKLAWMRDHSPIESPGPGPTFAWPCALLYDAGACVGYLMPEIQGRETLQVVMNPRLRSRRWPQFDLKRLHRTARSLTSVARPAHAAGYVIGDVNQLNALASAEGLVTLIDTDSFQVSAEVLGRPVIYHCTVGVPEYQPPEMLALPNYRTFDRTPEQDYWGIAVLIFQLLMQGGHPFRAIWTPTGEPPPIEERIRFGYFAYGPQPVGPVLPPAIPRFEDLHPQVQDLLVRCFIEGHAAPRRRPDVSDWERVLIQAEADLVRCPRDHFYQQHLPTCSACARPEPVAPIRRPDPARHPARPRQPGVPALPPAAPATVPARLGIPPLPRLVHAPVAVAPGPAQAAARISPRMAHPRLWRWTMRTMRVAAVVHLAVLAIALAPSAPRPELSVNPISPEVRLLRVAEARAGMLERHAARP